MSFASDKEAWLQEITRRLCVRLDPQLVLLFGSWARGTATRKSDIDLLVVWETELAPVARIGLVLDLLADSPWPVEAVVYTPRELEAVRRRPFVQRAFSEGRMLYERRAA